MPSPLRPGRFFSRHLLALVAVAVGLSACATRRPDPPAVATPRYPDFVFPAKGAAEGASGSREALDRGWRFLQAGDLKMAEREVSRAAQRDPAYRPLVVARGYLNVAKGAWAPALAQFDAVLSAEGANVAALVGRGIVLIELGRLDAAIAAFEAALRIDPGLDAVAERVEVLRLRAQQGGLAEARAEADAGRLAEARQAYQRALAASPDSAVVYRELALVERASGDLPAALGHLRRAVELDAADTASWTALGEALAASGRFDEALVAHQRAWEAAPSAATLARLESARLRADQARLPAEYGAIGGAAQVTRGDLAALVGVRLGTAIAGPGAVALLTDTRGHWAAAWIQQVVAAGVMDAYPNHAFRPRQLLRRSDLAVTISRLLGLAARRMPDRLREWEAASPPIADLPSGHLAYRPAAIAVASGVLTLTADGLFQPSRLVTGAETIEAIGRVEELIR